MAITVARQTNAHTSATTETMSLAGVSSTSSLIVGAGALAASAISVSSVVFTVGSGTFSQVVSQTGSSSDVEIWLCSSITPSSGNVTVQVTWSTTPTDDQCGLAEVVNMGALDTTNVISNLSSLDVPGPSISPAGSNEIFFVWATRVAGGAAQTLSGPNASGGFTYSAFGASAVAGSMGGFLISTDAAAHASDFTLSSSARQSVACAAAFKGPPPIPDRSRGVRQAIKRSAYRMQKTASGLFTPEHERERVIIPRLVLGR